MTCGVDIGFRLHCDGVVDHLLGCMIVHECFETRLWHGDDEDAGSGVAEFHFFDHTTDSHGMVLAIDAYGDGVVWLVFAELRDVLVDVDVTVCRLR